jgi:hypothetical protein
MKRTKTSDFRSHPEGTERPKHLVKDSRSVASLRMTPSTSARRTTAEHRLKPTVYISAVPELARLREQDTKREHSLETDGEQGGDDGNRSGTESLGGSSLHVAHLDRVA